MTMLCDGASRVNRGLRSWWLCVVHVDEKKKGSIEGLNKVKTLLCEQWVCSIGVLPWVFQMIVCVWRLPFIEKEVWNLKWSTNELSCTIWSRISLLVMLIVVDEFLEGFVMVHRQCVYVQVDDLEEYLAMNLSWKLSIMNLRSLLHSDYCCRLFNILYRVVFDCRDVRVDIPMWVHFVTQDSRSPSDQKSVNASCIVVEHEFALAAAAWVPRCASPQETKIKCFPKWTGRWWLCHCLCLCWLSIEQLKCMVMCDLIDPYFDETIHVPWYQA